MDLTDEEGLALFQAIKETRKIVEELDFEKIYTDLQKVAPNDLALNFYEKMLKSPFIKQKSDGYNIGCNDGAATGRVLHHFTGI